MRMAWLRNACDVLTDVLFPPRCPLCDIFVTVRDRPCADCELSLQRLEGDAHLPHLRRVWFTKCRSRFAFDGRVKDAIHSFKYNERFDLVRFFADELAKEVLTMKDADVIVPVPLHPKRLGKRGFNQSALIARRMGKILGVPADVDSLKRVRNIEPQVGLERDGRLSNVKGAFAVDDRRAILLKGRSIVLIDDVVTTGATVNECAKALHDAGVASVNILSIARAL